MRLGCALLCLLVVASLAYGEVQNVKVGGNIRVRGVMWDNLFDFNDDTNDSWEFYRQRTKVYVDADLTDNVRAYIRLYNEYRWAKTSKTVGVDNAYIEVSDMWGFPMTMKVGRQDLIYGEGFIILEGTPTDGSTTISFDAIKFSFDLGPRRLDLFTAKQAENDYQSADDEDFYGAYLVDNSLENHQIEAYLLFKNQNHWQRETAGSLNGRWMPPQETWALGTRWSGKFTERLSYAAEICKEWGDRGVLDDWTNPTEVIDERDLDAWGGYARLFYQWTDTPWKPQLMLGYVYLSGEEEPQAQDGDYKGWDNLYAEWPIYSELYIYTIVDLFDAFKGADANGDGVPDADPDYGAWTNMKIAQVGLCLWPQDNTSISLKYQLFEAVEEIGAGGGDKRGDMVQAVVKHSFNEWLSGHLWFEWFNPGDYYDEQDSAFFARWQLMVNF